MKPAAALGWSFAAIAASTSAAYAVTFSPDPRKQAVLAAISVLAVIYERGALKAGRKLSFLRDGTGRAICVGLLCLACLYTASMQLGFFGDLILAPQAHDQGAASTLKTAEQRVAELEQNRGWIDKPNGDAGSLAKLVASLEAEKKPTKEQKNALTQARKDLAAAEGREKIEADLAAARATVARLISAPPTDAKAAVIHGLTFGKVDPQWVGYALVVLAVVMMQAFQIGLPIVLGEGKIEAAAAPPAPKLDPEPVPVRLEAKVESPPAKPKPAPRIDSPPAPKAKAIESAPEPKQLAPPRRGGLASKVSASG